MSATVIVHRTFVPQDDGVLPPSGPTFLQIPLLIPLQTWCYNDMESSETCVVRLYEQRSRRAQSEVPHPLNFGAHGSPGNDSSMLHEVKSPQGGEVGLVWELVWLEGENDTLGANLRKRKGPQAPAATPAACRAQFFFPDADAGKYIYTDLVDAESAPWGEGIVNGVDHRLVAARGLPVKELGGVVFLSARHVLIRTTVGEVSSENPSRAASEAYKRERQTGYSSPALSLFSLDEEDDVMGDLPDSGKPRPSRRWRLFPHAMTLATSTTMGEKSKDWKEHNPQLFSVLHVSMLPKVIVDDDSSPVVSEASTIRGPLRKHTPSAKLVYLVSAESNDGVGGNFDLVVGVLSVAVGPWTKPPVASPSDPPSPPPLTVGLEHLHVERGVPFAASDGVIGDGLLYGLRPTDCVWLLVSTAGRALAAAGSSTAIAGRLIGVLPAAHRVAECVPREGPPRVTVSHLPRVHCCGSLEKSQTCCRLDDVTHSPALEGSANNDEDDETYIGLSLVSKHSDPAADVQSDIWIENEGNELSPLCRTDEQEKRAEQILDRWMGGEKLVYLVPLHDEGGLKKPLTTPLWMTLPLSGGASHPLDMNVLSSSPVFLEVLTDFLRHSETSRSVKPGVYVSQFTWKDVMHFQSHDRSAPRKLPVLRIPTRSNVAWAGLDAILSPSPHSAGQSEEMGNQDASRYVWMSCSPLSPFSLKLTPTRRSHSSELVDEPRGVAPQGASVVCCRTFLACHPVKEWWRLSNVYEVLQGVSLDVRATRQDGGDANGPLPPPNGWGDFLYLKLSPHPDGKESWQEDEIGWGCDDASKEDLFEDCLLAGDRLQSDDPAKVAWMLINEVWCSARQAARDTSERLRHTISGHPYIVVLDDNSGSGGFEGYLSNLHTALSCEPYQSDVEALAKKLFRRFLMLLVHLDWLATSEHARCIQRWVTLFFIGAAPPPSRDGEQLLHTNKGNHRDPQVEVLVAMHYLIDYCARFALCSASSGGSLRDEVVCGQEAPHSPSAQLAWFRRMLLLYIHRQDAVSLEVLVEDLLAQCSAFEGAYQPQERSDDHLEREGQSVESLEGSLLRAVDVELLMRSLACLSTHGGGLLASKDFIPLCCQWNGDAMPVPLFFIAAAVDVAAHHGSWRLHRKDLKERVGMWKHLASKNASALSIEDAGETTRNVAPSWIPSFLLSDGPTWLELVDYPWAAFSPLMLLLFWIESTCDEKGADGTPQHLEQSTHQATTPPTDALSPSCGKLTRALHVLYWLCQGQEDIAKDIVETMHHVGRDVQVTSEDDAKASQMKSALDDDVSSPTFHTRRRSVSLGAFAVLLDPQMLLLYTKQELKGRKREKDAIRAARISISDSFLVARVLHQCFACCTGKAMRHLVAAAAFSFLPSATTTSLSSVTPLDENGVMEDLHAHAAFLLSLIPNRELCLAGLEGGSGEAGLRRLALELAARIWEFVLQNDSSAPMNAVLIEKLLDAFIYLQNVQEKLQLDHQQRAECSEPSSALLHADLGSLLFRFLRGVFMVMLPKQFERVLFDEALLTSPKSIHKDVPVYTQYDSIVPPTGAVQAVGHSKIVGSPSVEPPPPPLSTVSMMQAGELAEATRRHVKHLLDLFQTHGLRLRCLRALYSITPTAMDFVELASQQETQIIRDTLAWMKFDSPLSQASMEEKAALNEEASCDDDDDNCLVQQRSDEESMHTGAPVLLPVPLSYVLASQAAPTDPAKLLFVSVLLRRQIKKLILRYLWDNGILEHIHHSPREIPFEDENHAAHDQARPVGKESSSDEVSPRDSLTTIRARAFNCRDYINDMVETLDPISQALVSTALGLYEPLIVLLFLDLTAQLVDAAEVEDPSDDGTPPVSEDASKSSVCHYRAIEFPAVTIESMRDCIRIAAHRTFDDLESCQKKVLRSLLRGAFHPYLAPPEQDGEDPAKEGWGVVDEGNPRGVQTGFIAVREAFVGSASSGTGRQGGAESSPGSPFCSADEEKDPSSPGVGMASALPSAMANLGETIRTAVVKGLPPVFSLPPRAREDASLSRDFPEVATEGDARFISDQTSLIKEEASLRRQISSSLQQDHMDYLRTTTFEHALGTLYVALRYEKLRREVHRFALEQLDLIFTFRIILHGDLLRAYREEGRQLAYQVAERHRQQVRLLIRQERDDRVGIEALCRVEGDDLWSIEAAQRGCFLEEGAVRQEWKAIEEDMRREILERFVRETQVLSKAKEKRCGRGPWEPRIQTFHPAEKRGSHASLYLGSSFGSADLSEGVVHRQPNSGEPWHLRGCVAPLSPSPQENAAGRESFPDWLEPAHAVHADSASSLSATVETTPPYASLTALAGAGEGLFSALHTFKTKLRETVAPTPLTRQPIATSGDATPRRRPFTRNEEANPSRARVGDAPKAPQPVLPSLLAKDNGEGWGWSEDHEPAGGGWQEAPCDARHVQKIPPSSLRSQIGKRDDPPRSQPRQQGGMPSMVALRREAPEARIVPLMKPSKESHQKDAGVGEPSGCLPLQASKRKTKRAPLAVALPAELVRPLTEVSTSEALKGVKNEVEKESKGSLPVQPGAPLLSCSRTSTGLVEGSERDLVKDEGDPPNDGNSPSFPSLSIRTIPTQAAVVVEAPPWVPSSVTQEGRDGVVVRKPTRKAAEGGKGGGGRERRARGLGLVVMALPSTDAPPSEQQEAPS